MSFANKFKKESKNLKKNQKESFSDRFGNKNSEMNIKKSSKEDSDKDLIRQEKLYLVTGKDKGRDAWYYMLVPKLKEPLFLKDIQKTKRNNPIIEFTKQVSDSVLRMSFRKSKKQFIKSEKINKNLRNKIISETLTNDDAIELVHIIKEILKVKNHDDKKDLDLTKALYRKIIKALAGKNASKYRLAMLNSDTIDLDNYGKIVESAYGKEPSESIKKHIEDKYG